jgi:1-acyl-sn-glycerol-3-phosphate acyltransferase
MFERLKRKQPGASLGKLFFYELCSGVTLFVARIIWRVRADGLENVPSQGSALLAANHQSFLDPPLIGSCIRDRHLSFIARSGLFKSPVFAWIIRSLNSIPIREDSGDSQAIKATLGALDGGSAVLIFPEGSRCDDGAIAPFKRGVWLLMKRSRCPIVPVAIEGAFDAWPNSKSSPRLLGTHVRIRYGKAIPHDDLISLGPDAGLERLRATIDAMRLELRREIREASGGNYPAPGAGDAPGAATQPTPSAEV